MPNQSANGSMFNAQRDRLRKLQDDFLAHPRLIKFAQVQGDTWELFGPGTPTTRDLREFVCPEYESIMREFLDKGFTG